MVELECNVCGKTFERKPCKIKRAEKHFCSNTCRYKGQELPKRRSWIKDGIVYLEITKGKIVLLDEIDKDLADLNWQSRKNYAAKKDEEGKHIYMHRIILERKLGILLKNDEKADHINSNKLDNRRENIRAVTPFENSTNTMKLTRINTDKKYTSKYKGVSFDKKKGLWRTRITHKGVTNHIGYYNAEEYAAKAYDTSAIAFFGNNAKLNFPYERYAWEIHKKSKCAYKVEA